MSHNYKFNYNLIYFKLNFFIGLKLIILLAHSNSNNWSQLTSTIYSIPTPLYYLYQPNAAATSCKPPTKLLQNHCCCTMVMSNTMNDHVGLVGPSIPLTIFSCFVGPLASLPPFLWNPRMSIIYSSFNIDGALSVWERVRKGGINMVNWGRFLGFGICEGIIVSRDLLYMF